MTDLYDIQGAFFDEIKNKLPPNHSFVHEVSELLGLSYDSAYRRIRGEKILSLEELYKLSTHFKISVDSLFDIKSGKTVFNSLAIDPEKLNVQQWLLNMLQNIEAVNAAPNKRIIYAAKDAPFFHYFHIPELTAFKLFFWQKTLFQFPDFRDKKFSMGEADPELFHLGQKILINYMKIPTTEIWNEDTFYIMLRQLEYYWISGLFENKKDLMLLIDKTEEWIKHLQLQAEHGFQFMYGQQPHGVENSFCLFENEVVLNDNTVLVTTDKLKTTFLTYNVVNLLTTTDPVFVEKIEHFLKGLLKKSIQISTSAAKERNRFFYILQQQIDSFRKKVK